MMLHKRFLGLRYFLVICALMASLSAVPVSAKNFWDSQNVLKDEAISQQFGERSKPQDIRLTIAKAIRFLFGFIGIIMLGMILMSGFKIMTAGGDSKAITDAKSTMINLILGFLLIASAYALTDFIIGSMLATANGGYYGWY